MSRATEKQRQTRINALLAHLKSSNGSPDPASLSRSYGLPEPEVRKIIGSTGL